MNGSLGFYIYIDILGSLGKGVRNILVFFFRDFLFISCLLFF